MITTNTSKSSLPTTKQATLLSIDEQQHRHIEKNLDSLLSALQKREPLDASYDSLLPVQFRKHAKASASIAKSAAADTTTKTSSKKNAIPANMKLHRRLNANLRSVVETYASTPAGWRRRPNTRRIDIDFGSQSSSKKEDDDTETNNNNAKEEELENKLRAAFALRESKEHEQRDLVNATLKAENAKLSRSWGFSQVTSGSGVGGGGAGVGQMPPPGMLPPMETAQERKKRLDGIAKQLREKEKGALDRSKWTQISKKGKGLILNPEAASKMIMAEYQASINTDTPNKQTDELKRKRALDPEEERILQLDDAKKREKIMKQRLKQEEEDYKRQLEKDREEQERRENALETPRDALHRLYEPIFTELWDMDFPLLGGTNPFRMVIDKDNCAAMGVPTYCDIIEKPMNLTYVQTKVNNRSYDTLQEFLEEIDLIANNAIKFNHQADNPYNIAAQDFRKRFRKLAKPLIESLTKR